MHATAVPLRTPLGFWIVAGLSLAWNAFGCFDFTMTNLRDADYMAQLPPEMIAYLDAAPGWATLAWAAGVWGALTGSLLLLARSRHAVVAFALSLLGLAVTSAREWIGGMPASMTTPPMLAMTAVIWVVAIFLVGYAARMTRTGALR